MKKIKYLILTFLFTISFFSCDNVDFGDINVNQNGSIEPATSGLLAGAIMTYATYTGRAGVTIPTLYVQYQSQVTYTDEMQYAEVQYGWGTYYTGSLISLNRIIEINSDVANHTPELLLQGDPVNQIGVAKILKAIIMKRVTDVYGDAPLSGAFLGLGDITPAYDTQENIYKVLIADIKVARDMLDPTKLTLNNETIRGDILFKGDLGRWKKLANSVILQMSLQLSKKYPGAAAYAATEFNAALSNANGVISTVADEAWFKFADVTGQRNPWFANRTSDYFLSQEFTDAMQGHANGATINKLNPDGIAVVTISLNPTSCKIADTRYRAYFRRTGLTDSRSNGVAYGYRNGSGVDDTGYGKNQMNRNYYWNAYSSLPLMTASYTYLNRAEAAGLGWTTEDPTVMLDNGIIKSFESLQAKVTIEAPLAIPPAIVPIIYGTTYRDARLAQIGVDATLLQVIGEEKWKSLFGQAFDAWAEWRRTGIPALVPATDAVNSGVIPRRFLYPAEEASLNGINYDDAVSRLTGGDHNDSKMWWDQ